MENFTNTNNTGRKKKSRFDITIAQYLDNNYSYQRQYSLHVLKLFNNTINRVHTYFIVTNIQHNNIVKQLHSNAADAGGGGSTRNLSRS